MKRITLLGILLSIIMFAAVSHAGLTQINFSTLLADQDMPVGFCGVYSEMPNLDPRVVCINCSLAQADALVVNGFVCGEEIKWDTGVETASGPYTVTKTPKGNPIPGRFEYKGLFMGIPGIENYNECPMYYADCQPASDACVSGYTGPIVAAIHGDIVLKYDGREIAETAWAAEVCEEFGTNGECLDWGPDFPGANWATYVHVPCSLPGICGSGLLSCDNGMAFCDSILNSQPENCGDGIDNDCDGLIDEGCDVSCPCWTAQTVDMYARPLNDPSSILECFDQYPYIKIEYYPPLVALVVNTINGNLYCSYADDEYGVYIPPIEGISQQEAEDCYEILINSQMWDLNCGPQ